MGMIEGESDFEGGYWGDNLIKLLFLKINNCNVQITLYTPPRVNQSFSCNPFMWLFLSKVLLFGDSTVTVLLLKVSQLVVGNVNRDSASETVQVFKNDTERY